MLRIAPILVVLSMAEPVLADDPATPGPEVLERDAAGQAIKIRLNGQVYDVCTPETSDGCINPRDAGLDQGNREIEYWPGKPASEIDEPLPVDKPEAEQAGQECKDSESGSGEAQDM